MGLGISTRHVPYVCCPIPRLDWDRLITPYNKRSSYVAILHNTVFWINIQLDNNRFDATQGADGGVDPRAQQDTSAGS